MREEYQKAGLMVNDFASKMLKECDLPATVIAGMFMAVGVDLINATSINIGNKKKD